MSERGRISSEVCKTRLEEDLGLLSDFILSNRSKDLEKQMLDAVDFFSNADNTLFALTQKAETADSIAHSGSNQLPLDSPVSTSSSITNFESIFSNSNIGNIEDSKNAYEENFKEKALIDLGTVRSIKRSMIDTSKLFSTYAVLKETYVKLCREFNYLLRKFNDNEKIKIDLINENNELRKLLIDTIRDREMEKRSGCFCRICNMQVKKRKISALDKGI